MNIKTKKVKPVATNVETITEANPEAIIVSVAMPDMKLAESISTMLVKLGPTQ